MKTNFKRTVLIFCLVILTLATFAVAVSAEKTDFAATAFSDITPANGWVHVGSQSAAADTDGEDIELYYIKDAEAYFNSKTKTLVIIGKDNLQGDYGDWLVSSTKNTPGAKYYLIRWGLANTEKVENIEFRTGTKINNGGYLLQTFKHVKSVKFASTIVSINGSKSDTALFTGMSSLETIGHGKWEADGKWTPVSYKEGVADMTGFTTLVPRTGNEDSKAALYQGSLFLNCGSVKEVIFPKSLSYTGSYKPAVEKDGKWEAASSAIEATGDEFGGEYAGVFAKNMFADATSIVKVTLPAEVELKAFESGAFTRCTTLRCITVNGTVSSKLKIAPDAFAGVADGCIIQCAKADDVKLVNKVLTDTGITNVKAVDKSVQPTAAIKVTKVPALPAFEIIDPDDLEPTAYGTIKNTNTNNWWLYFEKTKTLMIYAKNTSYYNEAGDISRCEDGIGWTEFKEEIEHLVIGPYINGLQASIASGMTNLKDIEITSHITQAYGTFSNTPNLTSIYYAGTEKVEGLAALMSAKSDNFSLNLSQTKIKEINMGSSACQFVGNIVPSISTTTLYFDVPSKEAIEYCRENFLNIKDNSGKSFGEWYVEIPEGLPACGNFAVYDFDETSGTLTIFGKGSTANTDNYWGGGSKNQPWFGIKDKIKHVIISENITLLGKYSFTECKNLETVQLPAKEDFLILNGAFQDCHNLKSVYIKGNQPIEGTVDLSKIKKIETYTFTNCYLIANAIINENVSKIGSSVFENCTNLKNIYGMPGSFAEEYASENFLTFLDSATNTPQPITCTPPDVNPDDTTSPDTTPDTTPDTQPDTPPDTTPDITPDTTPDTPPDTTPDITPVGGDDDQTTDDNGGSTLPVIIVVAVVVVVVAAAAIVIIAKKKKSPKAE